MPTIQHSINTRALTAFTPLEQELAYDSQKNYLFDLSYLNGITLIGDRSGEFLQGQLSCDVRDVNPETMQHGALCNLKGRILALLDVVDWQGLHLILPQDLRADTQASLAKTALFSKVTLEASTTFQVLGFHLRNSDDKIPFNIQLPTAHHAVIQDARFCCYHLGDNFYIFLVNTPYVPALCEPFIKDQWRGSLAWHQLQLQALHLDIYPESRGLFLPHRLGLQHSGHLSFNKGCYKGQEIIARTHYRAKLKHEMQLFTIKSDVPLQSGQSLLNPDGHVEIGELIDFCPVGHDTYLIAISALFEHPAMVLMNGRDVVLLP